jgi:hypothetical protein
MLKRVAIFVVVLLVTVVAGVLAYASTKPDTFVVERSTMIRAKPETIFAYLDDFHRFQAWSPYEKRDPAMKRVYEGPASGKGATYAWESKSLGTGRMQIADVAAPSKVTLSLDFVQPFEAHNIVEFTLAPQRGVQGDATYVTWTMRGEVPYLAKIMHVFFDMDRMVGADFEAGLADLKAVAEK